MMQAITMKTNRQWYPYQEFGSYFKLERGELWVAPMLKNGSIDGNEVNCGRAEHIPARDKARIAKIVKELEEKE